MRIALTLLAVLLTACATTPRTETVQEAITVKVPVTVAVPESLTRAHPVYQRTDGRVREYWTQAERNTVELEACNRDKAEIRALPTD